MEMQAILENIRFVADNSNVLMAEVAQEAVSLVTSPGGLAFLIIKIFFIVLSVALLGAVIYFLTHTNYLQLRLWQDVMEFFTYKPYGVRRLNKAWDKIFGRLDLPDEAEHKLAIIEADDLLDAVLKRMGYTGGNIHERLNHLTPVTLPSISQVLEVRKVRNDIVHDPDYHLTLDQARKTLEVYEKALRELQALE